MEGTDHHIIGSLNPPQPKTDSPNPVTLPSEGWPHRSKAERYATGRHHNFFKFLKVK